MTSSVETLYEKFLNDPDIVATTTKSREEVAFGEAKQRFIQSMNNHKALSLAKSGPVEDLFSFLRYRSVFKSEFSAHGFHPAERDAEGNIISPRQHYMQEYRKAPITHEELVQSLKDEYMSLLANRRQDLGGGAFPYTFDQLLADPDKHHERLKEAIIPDSQQLLFRPGQSGETTPALRDMELGLEPEEDEEEKTGRQKELEAQAEALLEGGDDEGGTATSRQSHRSLRGDPATALMGAANIEPGAGADKNAMELLAERAGNNRTAQNHVSELSGSFAEINRLQSVLDNPISTRGRKETDTQPRLGSTPLRGFDEVEQEYKQSIGLKSADKLSSDQEDTLSQIEGSRPYMERKRIEELQRLAESIKRIDTGHSDFSHATNADGSIRTHDTTENNYYSPVQQWHMFTRSGSSDGEKLQAEVKRRYDFGIHHGQHEEISSLIQQVAEDNDITLNTPPDSIEQNEAAWHETHPEGHTKTTPVKHVGEKDPEDMEMEELKDYLITHHEDLGPEGLQSIFDMIDADTTGKYQKKEMESLKAAITPRFLTDEQRLEQTEQARTARPTSDAPWIGDPNQAEMSDREANRMVGDFKRHPETVKPTGATTQEEYRQQALDVRPRAITEVLDGQGNPLPQGTPLTDEQGNALPRRTRMETEQEAIRRGPHRVVAAGETYSPELGRGMDRAGQVGSGWPDRVPTPRVAGAEHIGSTLAGGWRAEGVDYEGGNPLYPGENEIKLYSKDLTDLYLGKVPSASRRNSRGQPYTAANTGTQGGRVGFRQIMNYLIALGVPLQDLTRPNDKGKPVWSLYSMEQGMKLHGFLNDRDTLQYGRGGHQREGEASEGMGEKSRSQVPLSRSTMYLHSEGEDEAQKGVNRYPRILPGRGPGEGTEGAQSREGGPGHPAYDKRQALFAWFDAHATDEQKAALRSAGGGMERTTPQEFRAGIMHLLDGGRDRGAWLEAMGQANRQFDWDSTSGLTKDNDGNVIGKPMEGPYESWGFGNQGGDRFYNNNNQRELIPATEKRPEHYAVPATQEGKSGTRETPRLTAPPGFRVTDFDFTLPRSQWDANQRRVYKRDVEPLEIAKHKAQHERALLSGEPTFAHDSAGGARYFNQLVDQVVKDNPNKPTVNQAGEPDYISHHQIPNMPQLEPELGPGEALGKTGKPAEMPQRSEADLREVARFEANRKAILNAHPDSKEFFRQKIIKEFNDDHRGLIEDSGSALVQGQLWPESSTVNDKPIKLHWSDIARWFQHKKDADGNPYIRNPQVPTEYEDLYPEYHHGVTEGSRLPYVEGEVLPRSSDLPRRGEDASPTTGDPVVPPTAPEPTGGGESATEALLRQRQPAAAPETPQPAVDALVDRQRREAIGGANVRNFGGGRRGIEDAQAAERNGEGVNVLRKMGNEHYGNPFSFKGAGDTRATFILPTVEDATKAYDNWLHGRDEVIDNIQGENLTPEEQEQFGEDDEVNYRDVKPEQRQWILNQIQSGALNNKNLLYYTNAHKEAGIDSHADVLARFINEAKGQPEGAAAPPPDRIDVPRPQGQQSAQPEDRTEALLRQREDAPTGPNPADYTNHSGGAIGGDTLWDGIGKEHGITNHNHYYQGRPTSLGNTPISQAEADEAIPHLRQAAATMGRPFSEDSSYVGLLKRNWQQVKNADGIYAATTINKGSKGYKPTPNVADGGTGWAIHMAIHQGKPVHVFEPRDRKWYTWNSDQNQFVEEGTPTLTKNYAGIGSRELHKPGTKFPASDLSQADIDAAKAAIREVHEKTFRSSPRRGGRQYGGGMTGGAGGRMFGRADNMADTLHDILGHRDGTTSNQLKHRSEPRLEDDIENVLAMFHGGPIAEFMDSTLPPDWFTPQDIDDYKSQFSLGEDLDAEDINEMHGRIKHLRDAVKDIFGPRPTKGHYLDMMEHILEKLRNHSSYDSNHQVHSDLAAFEHRTDNDPYHWNHEPRVPKHHEQFKEQFPPTVPEEAAATPTGGEVENQLPPFKHMESPDYNHPNMPGNWQKEHFIAPEGQEYSAVKDAEALRQHHLDAKAQQRDANKDIGGAELQSMDTPSQILSSAMDSQDQQPIHFNTSPRREFEHYGSPFSYKDASDEAHQNAHIILPTADDAAQAYEQWLHGDFPVAKAGWYGGAHPFAKRNDRTGVQGAPDRQHMINELHTLATSSRKRAIARGESLEDWYKRKFPEGFDVGDFIDPNAVGDKNERGLEFINLGDVAPDRRKWVLEQIAAGKLNNKTLLHLPEGTKDAEVLQHYVNIHKGVPAYRGLENRPSGGSPNVLEYEKLTQQQRDAVMDAMEGGDPEPEELRDRDEAAPSVPEEAAAPAEQPAAEEAPAGPALMSLRQLNEEHITHRLVREAEARQKIDADGNPGKTSPYHAKSKWDFRKDDGTFEDGWDRIHLSRGMKDLALDNTDDDENPQPLIELLGGAQRGDRNPQWKWTDIGEREIAPILSAMHKFHHTSLTDNGPDFHSGPDGPTPYDDGVIHTETFEKILGYWKQGLLPTSFADEDMSEQHNRWEEFRRHSVEAAKQGNVPGPDTIIPDAPDQPAEEAAQPGAADIPDGSDSPMPPEEEEDLSNVSKEEVTAKLRAAWSKMAATEKELKEGVLGVPSGLTDADIYDNEGNVIVTSPAGERWSISNLRKQLQTEVAEAKKWHGAAVHLNHFVGAPNSYGPGSPGHPAIGVRAADLQQPERSTVEQTPHELNTALDRGTPDPTAQAPRYGEPPEEGGRRVAPEPAVQPSGAGGGWSPPPKPSQDDMNEHSPGITVRNFGDGDIANVRGAETIEGDNPYHHVDRTGNVIINSELYDRMGNRKPVRALHDAVQKSRSTAGDAPIVNVMRPQHSQQALMSLSTLVRTYGSPFTYPGEEYWGRDENHPGKADFMRKKPKMKRNLIMLPDAAAAAQAYRDWLNYADTTVRSENGKVYYLGNMAGAKRTGEDGEEQYTVNTMQRNWITKQLSEGALSGTVNARGDVIKQPSILGYHPSDGEGTSESYADVLAEIANERHVQAAIGTAWKQPPHLEIPGQQLSRLRSQLKEAWRNMDKIESQIKDMWSSTPDVTRNSEVTNPNHPDSHSFTDMDSDVSPTTLLQTVRTHQLGKGRGHVGPERDENGKRIPLPLDAEGKPDYSSILYHKITDEQSSRLGEHVPWNFGDSVQKHEFEIGSLLHTQPVMDTLYFEGAYKRFRALESAVEKASQLSTELANRGETLLPSQIPHPGMAGSPEHPNKASRLKELPEAPTAPDDGGPTEPPVVPPSPPAADQPENGERQKAVQGLADALQHRHQNLADQEEPTAEPAAEPPTDEPDAPPTGADRLETLGDRATNQAAGGPPVPSLPTGLVTHEEINSSVSPEDWSRTDKFKYAYAIVQRLIADDRLKNTATENYLKALTETMAIHGIHKGEARGFDASRSLGEFKDGSWSEDNDHQGVPFFPTLLGTLTKIERELVSHDDHDISIGELAHLGNVHGTNFSDVGTIKDGTATTPGRVDMFHRNPNNAGMRPHPTDETLDHPHTHNPSLVSDADDVDKGHLDRLNQHKPQTPDQLQAFDGRLREQAIKDSESQHQVQRDESYGRFGRGGERRSPEQQAQQDRPPTTDELNRSFNQNLPREEERQANSTGRRPGGGGRSGGGGGGFYPTPELKDHILAQAKKLNMSEQAINDTLMFDGGWKVLHDHVLGEHKKGLTAQTKEGVADTAALHPDAVQPPLQEGDDPTQYLRKLMIHVHQLFGKGRRPDAKVRPAWANAYQTAIDAGADIERLNQESRDFPQHRDGDKVYGGEEHFRSVAQQDMRNAHQNQEFHGIMNDPEALKQAYGDPAHYPHREDIIGHYGRHIGTNYNYTDDQGRVKRKRQHEVAANEEPSLTNPLMQHNPGQYGEETAAPYVAGLRAEQVDAYQKLHGDYQHNKREKHMGYGDDLTPENSNEGLRRRKVELNKQLHPEHQTRVTTTDADGNRVTRPIEEDDYNQIANGSIPHQDMTPGILDHPLFGTIHDEKYDPDTNTMTPGKRQLGIHVGEDWDGHWKEMRRLGDEHTRLTEKLDKATPNTAEHDEAINNVTQAQTNIDDHAASWHSRRNGGVSSQASFPDEASKDKDGNHTMVDIPGIGMMHRQQLDTILKSIKPHQAVALHNVTQNSDGTPNGAAHSIFEPDGVTGKEGKGAVVTHFGIFPSTPSTNATETHANNGTMDNWKIMGRDMGNRLHHAIRTGNPHLEHYNDATMIHDIRGVLGQDHPLLQNPRIKKVLDKTKMSTPPQRTASIPDTSQSTSPPRVTSPPITTGPSKTGIKAPIHAMNKFFGKHWALAEGQNPRYASTDTISNQLKRGAYKIASKVPGAMDVPEIKQGALNALDYHIQSMTPDDK